MYPKTSDLLKTLLILPLGDQLHVSLVQITNEARDVKLPRHRLRAHPEADSLNPAGIADVLAYHHL